MFRNWLPLGLAQNWAGLGYLETTQMPVSPFLAHHPTSDNADSALGASPSKVAASGSRDIGWVDGSRGQYRGAPSDRELSEAELFVRFMWPMVRSSLCTGRRDGVE